jgi:hypothetical protein
MPNPYHFMLLILLESHWLVKVHEGGLLIFKLMCKRYWILDKIFILNPSKLIKKNLKRNSGKFMIQLESFRWVKFLEGDFVTFRPKVKKILNFEWFSSWESNLIFLHKNLQLGSIVRVIFTLGIVAYSCSHLNQQHMSH